MSSERVTESFCNLLKWKKVTKKYDLESDQIQGLKKFISCVILKSSVAQHARAAEFCSATQLNSISNI